MPATPPTPKLAALSSLIGNTPLLEIHCRYKGREHRVYAKHEAYNFTGSIKDRMALYILQRAYANGEIAPGDSIAEATSGNTGISFAAIGRALGHTGAHLHARLDVAGACARHPEPGRRRHPRVRGLGGFLGSIRMADDFARESRSRLSAPAVRQPRECPGALRDHGT
jgi:cysteine synthase A